jgi:phage terminase large subunit-like protein
LKTITDATDSETRGQKDEDEKKKEELLKAKKRKGANTIVDISIYKDGESGNGVIGGITLTSFIKKHLMIHPKGTKYVVTRVYPADPANESYSKKEVDLLVKEKSASN